MQAQMNRPADDHGAFLPGPRARLPATGRGPLDGLRLAVKDLIDLEGHVTGAGNPDWAAAEAPAAASAPVVEALRAAGAEVVGKTVTDELAFSLEGANAHYGTPVNPAHPGCLPGGSSSGSAVAVAAGLAEIGLGTDTGGSVRVPGAFCGLWAFRPTHGALPLTGVTPFAPGYDTLGWLTRDAQTLARVGAALLPQGGAGIDEIRLAVDCAALAAPDLAEALDAAAQRIAAGELRAFPTGWQDHGAAYASLQAAEIRTALGPALAVRRPRFGAEIAPRFAAALAPDAEVPRWLRYRARARAALDALLPPGRALLLPTASVARLPLGASGAEIGTFYARTLALSAIAGHAGAPQLQFPYRGMGLSLVARPGADAALLAHARLMSEIP